MASELVTSGALNGLGEMQKSRGDERDCGGRDGHRFASINTERQVYKGRSRTLADARCLDCDAWLYASEEEPADTAAALTQALADAEQRFKRAFERKAEA